MRRPHHTWRLRSRALELGERTLVMGVLNVTPDSFSDGGLYLSLEKAVDHGLRLLDEGADILDIGGESTRPGSSVIPDSGGLRPPSARPALPDRAAVSAEEELRRVIPVIDGVLKARPGAVISIDTYKSGVARAAVEHGAEIVNDVSAFRWDTAMAATVADLRSGAVLMHMRGRPEEWRTLPPPDDIVGLVRRELGEWAAAAEQAGVRHDCIVLDPGFGFGKNFEQNYPLLAGFAQLHDLGYPLLAGTSRKSFIGRTLAREGKDAPPAERLYGTIASTVACILQGAHIVRVHDVKAAMDGAKVADAILNA